MAFCEMWLEMRSEDKAFRVVLLVPAGTETPSDYNGDSDTSRQPEKEFFVSEWFSRIADAESSIMKVAKFYGERSIKFVVFREIRPLRTN